MFKRDKKIESIGSIANFMSGEYKNNQNTKNADKGHLKRFVAPMILAPAALLAPVAAFAAEPTGKCVTAMSNAIPVNSVGDYVGAKTVAALTHLFDPLIAIVVHISFPVASAMILFKLFMGFFQDQGQVWEGIGRVALVYVLVQMFPVFSEILKNLGNAV